MSIFDFDDYLEFLDSWLKSQPKGGRGLKGKIAKELSISSTLVSFLFSGEKVFTLEQASDFADFLGFSEPEAQYFILLVEIKRAGHDRLRKRFITRKEKEKKQGKRLKTRVSGGKKLGVEESAIFYSSWVHSAIRNLAGIKEVNASQQIAEHLKLPLATVHNSLQFLLHHGLLTQENGTLKIGTTYTYIDDESPFTNKHRQNWRLRGISEMDFRKRQNLFYTCPMSLSAEDAERVRVSLMNLIVSTVDILKPSPSEVVRCLNIDWFEY